MFRRCRSRRGAEVLPGGAARGGRDRQRSYGLTQTGSSFRYVGSQIAATDGITLSFKPLQKVGAVIGTIRSGQIDAWNIAPHIAKPLAKSGKVHIVGAVQDYVPNYSLPRAAVRDVIVAGGGMAGTDAAHREERFRVSLTVSAAWATGWGGG